jgi:hypothetical protein
MPDYLPAGRSRVSPDGLRSALLGGFVRLNSARRTTTIEIRNGKIHLGGQIVHYAEERTQPHEDVRSADPVSGGSASG